MKKLGLLTIVFGCVLHAAQAQVTNTGFEEWDSAGVVNGIKIYNPVNWFSRNAEMAAIGKAVPVTLTTDAHSGSFAVKITSKPDDGEKSAGVLYSGNKAPLGDPTQTAYEDKFKLTGRIKSYSAWYKYSPATPTDSFIVMIAFYLRGQAYGSAYYTGGASNGYQQFVWTLTYPDNIPPADSAKFLIFSSSVSGNTASELILDDIAVQYKTPTGTEAIEKPIWSIYPNPVDDHMTLLGFPPKVRAILVANSMGAVVKQPAFAGNSIDVSDLKEGFYWLTVVDENGTQSTIKFAKR
jgi:hypothetical protein